MKKKKGFTLVELMSVIVVLTIIIAIAMPVYSKIKMSIEKRNYENKVELIQIAAAKYAEDTNITTIYVDDLVKQGYIDADDEKGNVYNDLNKRINCYIVQTEEKSGIYYSKLLNTNYENKEKECPANIPNELTNGFKIIMYDGNLETQLKYKTDSKWWTKNDVILKADFGENQPTYVEWYEGYSNTPLTENISGNNKEYLKVHIDDQNVLQQNYTAKTRTKDGKLLTATVGVYIDKIEPKFYNKDALGIEGENVKWTTSKEYNIQAYDNESGLYKYMLTKPSEACPTTKEGFDGQRKNLIEENGIYKACIIDQVGNPSKKEVTITKIDSTEMACSFEVEGTKGNIVDGNQWYIKDDVKLTLKPHEVGPSGVYLGISSGSIPVYPQSFSYEQKGDAFTYTSISENMNNKKYYGYIKNETESKNQCEQALFVEKSIDAPVDIGNNRSYDTITVNYSSGNTTSGIARTECLRTDIFGNKIEDGTVLGNNCQFKVTASKTDTNYYFRKCITSKAGNKVCSSISTISNIGYCSSGNTEEKIEDEEITKCNKKCDEGTQNVKRTTKYISKYNGEVCSQKVEQNKTISCKIRDCCSDGHIQSKVTKGNQKLVHDIYLKGKYYSNGSNGCNVPQCTQILYYYTYCNDMQDYDNEVTNHKCDNKYVKYCTKKDQKGSCKIISGKTCLNLRDELSKGNLYISFDKPNKYFTESSRSDDGDWHINAFSCCKTGTEVCPYRYNNIDNFDCSSTQIKYQIDKDKNLHEWYIEGLE